jgi:hypothetical protein
MVATARCRLRGPFIFFIFFYFYFFYLGLHEDGAALLQRGFGARSFGFEFWLGRVGQSLFELPGDFERVELAFGLALGDGAILAVALRLHGHLFVVPQLTHRTHAAPLGLMCWWLWWRVSMHSHACGRAECT